MNSKQKEGGEEKRKKKVKKENEILLGLWGSSFPARGPPHTHCDVWVGGEGWGMYVPVGA